MKEFLSKSASVLAFIFTWFLSLLPIAALSLPLWADFIIITAVGTLDGLLFCIPSLVLWVLGLIAVLKHSITWFSILYIIVFVVKFAYVVVCFVSALKDKD